MRKVEKHNQENLRRKMKTLEELNVIELRTAEPTYTLKTSRVKVMEPRNISALLVTPTFISQRCYVSWSSILNKIIDFNLNPVH